jgi:hypothetical protein
LNPTPPEYKCKRVTTTSDCLVYIRSLVLNENNKNDNHNSFLVRLLMLNGEKKIKGIETGVHKIIRIESLM